MVFNNNHVFIMFNKNLNKSVNRYSNYIVRFTKIRNITPFSKKSVVLKKMYKYLFRSSYFLIKHRIKYLKYSNKITTLGFMTQNIFLPGKFPKKPRKQLTYR